MFNYLVSYMLICYCRSQTFFSLS